LREAKKLRRKLRDGARRRGPIGEGELVGEGVQGSIKKRLLGRAGKGAPGERTTLHQAYPRAKGISFWKKRRG